MTVNKIIHSIKTAASQREMEYIDALRLFFEDEFFRRLSKSDFHNELILRGGFLVWQLTDFSGLASRDIDFLLLTEDSVDAEYVENIINTATSQNQTNEIICFEIGEIKALDKTRQYDGYTVLVKGTLGEHRAGFKINIGIGDKLYHQPELIEIPAVIDEFDSYEVNAYPVESVIAEKFEMLLCRFGLDNCAKPLYDIYLLSQFFDFDGFELQHALTETLKNRKNDNYSERFFNEEVFLKDEYLINQWKHFSRVNNIEPTLNEVFARVSRFVQPIWLSYKRGASWKQSWSGVSGRWEDSIYLY